MIFFLEHHDTVQIRTTIWSTKETSQNPNPFSTQKTPQYIPRFHVFFFYRFYKEKFQQVMVSVVLISSPLLSSHRSILPWGRRHTKSSEYGYEVLHRLRHGRATVVPCRGVKGNNIHVTHALQRLQQPSKLSRHLQRRKRPQVLQRPKLASRVGTNWGRRTHVIRPLTMHPRKKGLRILTERFPLANRCSIPRQLWLKTVLTCLFTPTLACSAQSPSTTTAIAYFAISGIQGREGGVFR